MITAATLILVGAIVVSLERHRQLTPVTALLTGLGTLAIASVVPATADVVPRSVTDNQLPERITDFDLPTL